MLYILTIDNILQGEGIKDDFGSAIICFRGNILESKLVSTEEGGNVKEIRRGNKKDVVVYLFVQVYQA